MDHVKKFLALLLLASVAHAQLYPKSPIPPTIPANTVLCNATGLVAAPSACAAFAIVEGLADTTTFVRTGALAGAPQVLKLTNTYSATPGTGTGIEIATETINTTVGPMTGAADFNDLVAGLATNLTLATNSTTSSTSHQAFIAKTQKNSCYPALTCTKGYSENLIVNDYTGRATTGTYKSGGMVGSELDMRANNADAAGSAAGLIPASVGIRTGYDIVFKSYVPATPDTPLTVTGASGDGATATLTFASQTLYPQAGSTIVVAGMTPSGYNTAGSVVTASTATSVSYANATTGFTSGGTLNLPAAVFGWGYRCDANPGDTITVNRCFSANNVTLGGAGFTTEFATLGANASSFRMAGGQNLGWDMDAGSGATAYAKHQTFYDEGNSWLAYAVSGTSKFMVDDTGKTYANGMFGLGANPLTLGTQTYGTAVTVSACGSVTCANSILLGGGGSGVAPSLRTLVTGTSQADLNMLIAGSAAAAASGLNGGSITISGGAPDGAHNYGSVALQSSINGNTTLNAGTSTGTTTIGNSLSTFSLVAGTVSGAGWAALPAITATSVTTPGQLTSSVATGTAPLAVTSTTNVANLNASSLNGATFAAPGAIGGGTPSTGAFTSVSGTTTVTAGTKYVHGVTVICQVSAAAATSHTGDSSEFNLANCTIPAGRMSSQAQLRITALWLRTAVTTNTVAYFIRFSTTQGDTSGGDLVLNNTNATSSVLNFMSLNYLRNTATNAQLFSAASLISPYANNTGAMQTGALDTAASTTYVNFNCKDTTSTADTCGIYSYLVELIEP